MDSFCGYNTCTANKTSNDSFIITHEAVQNIYITKNYLHTLHVFKYRHGTNTYRSVSKTDTMETFCEEDHFILPEPFIFTPDCQKKIRISIENIPIKLQDTKMRTFLSQYATLVGKIY